MTGWALSTPPKNFIVATSTTMLAISAEYAPNRNLLNCTRVIHSCTSNQVFIWADLLAHLVSFRRLWTLIPHVETALPLYLSEIRPIHAARKTLENQTTTAAVSQPCREYHPDTAPRLPFCGTTGSFDLFSGMLLAYLRNRCTLYGSEIEEKVVASNILWATSQISKMLIQLVLDAAKDTFNTRYSRASKTDGSLHRG